MPLPLSIHTSRRLFTVSDNSNAHTQKKAVFQRERERGSTEAPLTIKTPFHSCTSSQSHHTIFPFPPSLPQDTFLSAVLFQVLFCGKTRVKKRRKIENGGGEHDGALLGSELGAVGWEEEAEELVLEGEGRDEEASTEEQEHHHLV